MDILEQLRKCAGMVGEGENPLEPYNSAANEIEMLRDRVEILRGIMREIGYPHDIISGMIYDER